MFVKSTMKDGKRSLRIDLGHLLGMDNPEDAHVTFRELTVGEALGWRTESKNGEEALAEYCRKIFPDVIIEHDLYKTPEEKMSSKEAVDFLWEKFSTTVALTEEVSRFNFLS